MLRVAPETLSATHDLFLLVDMMWWRVEDYSIKILHIEATDLPQLIRDDDDTVGRAAIIVAIAVIEGTYLHSEWFERVANRGIDIGVVVIQ